MWYLRFAQLLPVMDVDVPGEVSIRLFPETLSHMFMSGNEEIVVEKRAQLFCNTL